MSEDDMKFDELLHFVESEMSMTRWYQPAVIRTLVDADGCATFRTLANGLLPQDERYVSDAESVVRRWPKDTLKKRGVIEVTGNVVRLRVRSLTLEQRSVLRAACDAKLQSYWERNGLPKAAPVSAGLRFRVLRQAGGRCELCNRNDRALDIDHIVPVSKGGSSEESNLQVLCYECNRGKRDTDQTDFRDRVVQPANDCHFCARAKDSSSVETEGWMVAFPDKYPVTKHHYLLVPLRHKESYFDLTDDEHRDAGALLARVRNMILAKDSTVTAFNVGVNAGAEAGQTIGHAHIHVIPRRAGDIDDPRGGVRGVIPSKKLYEGLSE